MSCEHILKRPSSAWAPVMSLAPPRLHCRLSQVPSHHPPGWPAQLLPKLRCLPVLPSSCIGSCIGGTPPSSTVSAALSLDSGAPSPQRPVPAASTHCTLHRPAQPASAFFSACLPPQLARLLPWAPSWFGPQFILHVVANVVLSKRRRS